MHEGVLRWRARVADVAEMIRGPIYVLYPLLRREFVQNARCPDTLASDLCGKRCGNGVRRAIHRAGSRRLHHPRVADAGADRPILDVVRALGDGLSGDRLGHQSRGSPRKSSKAERSLIERSRLRPRSGGSGSRSRRVGTTVHIVVSEFSGPSAPDPNGGVEAQPHAIDGLVIGLRGGPNRSFHVVVFHGRVSSIPFTNRIHSESSNEVVYAIDRAQFDFQDMFMDLAKFTVDAPKRMPMPGRKDFCETCKPI